MIISIPLVLLYMLRVLVQISRGTTTALSLYFTTHTIYTLLFQFERESFPG